MKKHGFTLAEVLITLVIIGVIAALTIPNLLQKYQEQTTVKKVQKFYSNLSNAYALAMKENGPASDWGLTGDNEENSIIIYNTLFKPYFKIAKNCGNDNTGKCIKNITYKRLNGGTHRNFGKESRFYKIALDDGATVWWRGTSSDEGENTWSDMFIFYDVNGIKEPNQWGKDLFLFFIKNQKAATAGLEGAYSFNAQCNNTATLGLGCTAWVVYKGNMDYLHCDGLTWTSRSCKEK